MIEGTGHREPLGFCFVCDALHPYKLGLCRVHRKYYDFEGKRLEKEVRLNHEWRKANMDESINELNQWEERVLDHFPGKEIEDE